MKREIQELISQYNAIILALEKEIDGEHIGNNYRVGRRSALVDVVKDLQDLLEEEGG